MSTSPETSSRPDDRIVSLLSHWLARHVDDAELLRTLKGVPLDELSPDQADAVEELVAELRARSGRGELEMVVRETLEALALG